MIFGLSVVAVVYGSAGQLTTDPHQFVWFTYTACVAARVAYVIWKDGQA